MSFSTYIDEFLVLSLHNVIVCIEIDILSDTLHCLLGKVVGSQHFLDHLLICLRCLEILW